MSAASEPVFQPPSPPSPTDPEPPPRPKKLRPFAIGLFVLGLLLVIGQIAGFVPGGASAGAAFAFCGLALFGLSFIRLPQLEAKQAPMSTVQTLMAIFYEPTAVFRNLRVHPRWIVALLVVAVLSTAYSVAFVRRVTPERIVNFTTDKLAESGFMTAEVIEQQRQIRLEQAKNPTYQAMSHLSGFAVTFLKYCVFTGLVFVGILAFGGRMNFWQAFAAVIYAVLPWTVIQKVLSLILLYIKSPDDIHPILNQDTLVQDNLGAFISPADHPVLFVLASVVGLLWIYWIWLLAKGLQHTGTKVSGSAAWGVTITLTVLMVGAGAVMALLFGSFMS